MNRGTMVVAVAMLLAMVSSAAVAKVFQYKARLAAPVETEGSVRAGVFNWKCKDKACTINGPWAEPGVGHCKALAKQVGEITSYGHGKAKLDEEQLKECNSVVQAEDAP